MRALLLTLLLWTGAAHASTAETLPTVQELTAQSAAVVEAQVVATETQKVRRQIKTRYTLEIKRRITGDTPRTLTVTLPGGHHEGLTVQAGDVPIWKVGDDVIVFLNDQLKPSLKGLLTVHKDEVEGSLIRQGHAPPTLSEFRSRVLRAQQVQEVPAP